MRRAPAVPEQGEARRPAAGERWQHLDRADAIEALRRKLERFAARSHPPAGIVHADAPRRRGAEPLGIDDLRPWRRVETLAGEALEHIERHAPDSALGKVPFARAMRALPARVAQLAGDERLAGLHLRDVVFFDIESTGLGVGVGVMAFLVGIGRVLADGSVEVRQVFAPDPASEAAALARVVELMGAARAVASFNGKGFDAHVLANRLLVHRLERNGLVQQRPHLDLLHIHRAIWREALPDCRQGTLERAILRWARRGDVSGAEVPARYFAFLRSGDAQPLDGVLRHNAWDVAAMIALAGALCAAVEAPDELDDVPRAALGIALVRRGQWRQGAAILASLDPNRRDVPWERVYRAHASALRRLDDARGLERLLERAVERFADAADWWEALAVCRERRLGDLRGALDAARRAQRLRSPGDEASRLRDERRIARLSKRVGASGRTDRTPREAQREPRGQ